MGSNNSGVILRRVKRLTVGEVDTQSAAVEVDSIELLDGVVGRSLVSELAEAESLRAAGLTVVDETTKRANSTQTTCFDIIKLQTNSKRLTERW